MAQIKPAISQFSPLTYFLLLLLSTTTTTTPILALTNITAITTLLSSFPDFSSFTSLLTSTPSLISDLSNHSPLTLLAIPNSYLTSSLDFTRRLSPSSLADLLRYHVLLKYLSSSELNQIPPSGILITTLFQTTGRASSNFGSVNITRNPITEAITVSSPFPYSSPNATVLSLIKTLPYNISIISVNSLLVPHGFDLMASETRPTLGLNITQALLDGHNFFVSASLLSASGVVQEFEADEGGAGITLFVPTDSAFSDLSATSVSLQSLPADKKAVVLKFHVLHSYYPLGSLESIVNPVQPTLATEDMGAGSFTLNISRVNGSVAINSGIVQASVTQTVFDQNPVAIFGVSKVLLPKEIFGKNPVLTNKPGSPDKGDAQPPVVAFSPETSPNMLSSAPGFREEIKSGVGIDGLQWLIPTITGALAALLSASTAISLYFCRKKSKDLGSKIQQLEVSLNSSLQKCAAERQGRIRAQQALRKAIAQPKSENLEQTSYPLTPIGVVQSCFSTRNGTPRQPLLVPLARACLVFDSARVPPASLEGLAEYSHCWIIYVFHLNTDLEKLWKPSSRSKFKAKVRVPRLKGGRKGVFATRSPHRPCPIGLTVAKVEAVRENMVLLSGVDLVDGTPILDIKPYLPYCDSIQGAAVPEWVMADNMLAVASVSFSKGFSLSDSWETAKRKSLYASPDELQSLIEQVLSWDIRSVSQRNQPHDPFTMTANGEAPYSTPDSEQNQDEGASVHENDKASLPSGDVIYHLILEGIDVTYRIDGSDNVIVEKAVVSSHIPIGNQNRSNYLMWRDALST